MGVRKSRWGAVFFLLCLWGMVLCVQAGSGARISYSPDGQAFTTCGGDTSAVWYEKGMKVRIREETGGLEAGPGEHIYYWKRTGSIPIGYWEVAHPCGKCIHKDYGMYTNFHQVTFGRRKCGKNYYSGWLGYCADCGEAVIDFLVYMNGDTAAALTEVQTGMGYYYLCPWCSNLEQATEILPHTCQAISANRYTVVYEANGGSGYMAPSVHMYNDTPVYEGREITPQTTLSLCSFGRIGYRFAGWNTQPDGSGQSFEDGALICNLSQQEGDRVSLYAQWRRSRSLLRIDPGEGSYQGRKGVTAVEGDYGSTCQLDSSRLTPPEGYTVTFDARGGSPVKSITGSQLFREWKMSTPFYGKLEGNVYRYQGEDGTEDRVTAVYTRQSIILPEAEKKGVSFGGWYYDPECTQPAGSAGSSFTPDRPVTLYAGWVELQLQAQDNYSANSGRGAVNLNWSQQDNARKTYKLYQQREGGEWQQIRTATDIGAAPNVSRSLTYTGSPGSYLVPYTGFYRLTLTGAQGSGCGSMQGGKGGLVEGVFYLSQGERLTYVLGGRNGYHGGGTASAYGVGGGSSELSSDRRGLLLIAGGGGGATDTQDGMPGGSAGKNVSGRDGESGKAGGGGGYQGGAAGVWETHQHTVACRHIHTGDAGSGGGCYTEVLRCGSTAFRREEKESRFYYGNRDGNGNLIYCPRCASFSCNGHLDRFYRYICTGCGADYDEKKPAVCTVQTGYALGCGRTDSYICGLTEGQVLASSPAYGGSNYIQTAACSSHTEQAGRQSGNGTLQITSVSLGYLESNLLNGVAAADLGKPEKINLDTLRLIALGENQIRVCFDRPEDTGTTYYHKAESYVPGSDRMLCQSNITANTLTTGIQGYRYVVDRKAGTVVNAAHQWYGDQGSSPSLTVTMDSGHQYLHMAAQDRAGNLGETIHILLSQQMVIAWPVRTEPIRIASDSSVWPGEEENTYYVRAGESAPFTVSFTGALCGPAREDYQITHLFFSSRDLTAGAEEGGLGIITPARDSISRGTFTYQAAQLQKLSVGKPCVGDGSYTVTRRSNSCRDLDITRKLYLPGGLDGHRIRLTPAAAAVSGRESVTSDNAQDLQNSIWLIGDAAPPVISGMEQLEDLDFLEQPEADFKEVELTAWDEGSGLAEFYVEVCNQDNGSTQRFSDQGTGIIRLRLSSQEALFSGDFTVIAHAIDHVGNEAAAGSSLQGLSLQVKLERMLEPHDPVFKAGESGILSIVTTGYVERVEVIFPPEMNALDPSLNRVYTYKIPDYMQEEKLTFMVPLQMPDIVSEIIVRAYKKDTGIEEHPRLTTLTVDGNVLDELRTRLR